MLLIVLLNVAAALAEPRPLTVRRVGTDQGLSQVTARALAQDAFGLIWIGTENGLSVFDGVRFSYFRHDPENSVSLSDNYVRALLPDAEGGMWVGTLGGGLNHHVAGGGFIRYPTAGSDGLPSAEVEALFAAVDGALWIGHGVGASRLDVARGGYTHFREDGEGALGAVLAIAQTGDGDIWLGRAQGGLRRVGASGVRSVDLPVDGPVLRLHVAHDGHLWVGTERGGLFRIDPRDGRVDHIPGDYDAEVTSILQDEQGAIWFGTWSGGLYRLDPGDGRIDNHRTQAAVPTSLSSNTVVSLMRDQSGVLWAGTYDAGVNLVMPYDGALEHHAFDPTRPDGLIHAMVWSFAEGPTGEIWVGTRRGLSRFDPAAGTTERYLASGRCGGPGIGVDVRAILPEQERLWLGLADGGLVLLDPASCRYRAYGELLTSRRVRLLLRDATEQLWIGTDNGLNRLDPVSGWVRHYRADGGEGSLPHNRIRSLYEDGQGTLWVGTSGGLSRYDAQEDRFVTWTHSQGHLSDNDVRGIHRDEAGILWLATGIGLTRLDPASGEAGFFYERHGLSNNTLYSVIPDGPYLWITTNSGLTRFDRRTYSTIRFDQGDGLQSNEFNFNAYLKTASGELLLGGIGGFNRLRPDRLLRDAVAPRLHLAYLIDNQPARIVPAGGHGEGAPVELKDGSIRFQARVLHYLNSMRNGYRYRLLGHEERWSHASAAQTEVSYAALPPGDYRFQIVGFTGSGVESGPPLEVHLRVPRPLWLQPWTLVPGLVALLGLAWLLAGLRTRALRLRATRLQAEVDAKTGEIAAQNERLNRQAGELERLLASQTEFYRRIAHELKTPLTLVSLPLKRLSALIDRRTEVRDAASTIARGVERLDQLVEQLTDVALDPRDVRATDRQTFGLGAFLLPLVGLYRHSAEAAGKTLRFAPIPDAAVTLHRAVFEDVLHNLLANAVKYTREGGRIDGAVELLASSGRLRLCVEDDGPGLTAAECERIFDSGFRTAHAAACDPAGHGEGLHICRSRLRAVGGDVTVSSEPGRGCRFVAEFPCTWSGEADRIASVPEDRPAGRRQADATAGDADEAPHRAEILFIEDDPDLRPALADAFGPYYRLGFACSLGEGLALAKECMPDLIVCDRMLPDGEGLTLVGRLKADADTCHIPVVVLSALSTVANQQEGWRSLADDYVAKPFQPETLRLRIESHLENRRRTREWARAQLTAGCAPAVPPADDAPNTDLAARTAAEYVRRLEEAVFARLAHNDCRLETVAADVRQSPRTLQRKLQALYGCGFAEYVVDLQLRRARTLLEAGASAKRAALEAGFSSQSYMSRVFRKRLGTTPSAYKAEAATEPSGD
ncbi:hybrid sensor histidine kinase/response regulator transcription factor [Pseudothauera nasutitermitis]|uniref:hybrid sensor histidine kinase/response regulator transcription factor n=1 Tax=Pseudothauera nasutitermitis TaxID=2565930 RepID=UPI001454DF99|nr:two-component regulator propeller domain-containing protein [Pseudothauera nasutitermitis]